MFHLKIAVGDPKNLSLDRLWSTSEIKKLRTPELNSEHAVLKTEIDNYIRQIVTSIQGLQNETVVCVAELIHSVRISGANIFVCGNGGSAALSQHFAIDLGLGTSRELLTQGCRIFDLTSNAAVITATSNDIEFDQVYSRQIELYGTKDDLLIAISSSGNSRNILNAVSAAKNIGMKTVGLSGFDGGKIKNLVDCSVHFETPLGNYGVVEDLHSSTLHLLTHLVRCLGKM